MPPTRRASGSSAQTRRHRAGDASACRPMPRRAPTLAVPLRTRGRVPHRSHQAIHAHFRSDCFAPGPGCTCRCRCSPGRCRAAGANHRPRPPSAAMRRPCTAPATRNGPGLREFRDGDSPRQVAWAAYARGRGLLVKTYQSPAAHHRTFDLAAVPGADVEQRLEQLAGVDRRGACARRTIRTEARRPEVAPDSGSEHRARCLDGARAVWQRRAMVNAGDALQHRRRAGVRRRACCWRAGQRRRGAWRWRSRRDLARAARQRPHRAAARAARACVSCSAP